MRSAEFGMRNGRTVQGSRSLPNAECGIRNAEWTNGSRSKVLTQCGMRSSECGMNITPKSVREYESTRVRMDCSNAECGVRNAEWTNGSRCKVLTQCGMRNSECGIHVKCGTPRGYPNTQRVPECGIGVPPTSIERELRDRRHPLSET